MRRGDFAHATRSRAWRWQMSPAQPQRPRRWESWAPQLSPGPWLRSRYHMALSCDKPDTGRPVGRVSVRALGRPVAGSARNLRRVQTASQDKAWVPWGCCLVPAAVPGWGQAAVVHDRAGRSGTAHCLRNRNSPLSVHVTFGLVPQVPGHRQNVTWTPTKRFLFLIKIFIWREARPGRRPGQGRGVA